MPTPVTITDRNFADEVLGATQTVIVHFFGRNCPLCHRLQVTLQILATELPAEVQLASVNVAHYRSLGRRLGIVMIPTLIVFVRGVERLRLRGVFHLDELSLALRGLLSDTALGAGREATR